MSEVDELLMKEKQGSVNKRSGSRRFSIIALIVSIIALAETIIFSVIVKTGLDGIRPACKERAIDAAADDLDSLKLVNRVFIYISIAIFIVSIIILTIAYVKDHLNVKTILSTVLLVITVITFFVGQSLVSDSYDSARRRINKKCAEYQQNIERAVSELYMNN